MNEMTFERMIQQMTPTIYDSLKQAVALRKWPDGQRLSDEQTELCLEAVMRYEIAHNVPEHERVGYMQGSCKSQAASDEDSIKWMN
ncbi:YeaC family protein [Modicisalibacter radicis]|uniref:YeaC family protein n=1 Tax=Halomonas sp. EAR18 TaxID=2518972 RepID=UPI00109CD2D0|nr:DUF1315 family protein [Halomonas sp. EAR18]